MQAEQLYAGSELRHRCALDFHERVRDELPIAAFHSQAFIQKTFTTIMNPIQKLASALE